MLSLLRRKKNNPIIVFFLALIILVFVAFFGPAMDNCAGGELYAARVNGHTITDQQLAREYSRNYREYQSRFPEFGPEMAQTMKLRENSLDRLINTQLIADEAKKRGLTVDDKALAESIMNIEFLKTDGQFDKKKYESFVNGQALSPSAFETSWRKQILAQDLVTILQGAVAVSSGEARLDYDAQALSINLELIRVPLEPYESQVGSVTQADVDAWLARPDADAQIDKYYQKNRRAKYDTPKQVRARHILTRVPPGAPDADKKKALERAAEALKKVNGGADFAAVAREYSDDSTKDKGGDLGFFSEGQMVRPFEEAAFALKVGEVSRVVESPFGYHVIKVEEIKEPVRRKLEDVKDEIARELAVDSKAADLAQARAQAIFDLAKSSANFEEAIVKATQEGKDPMPLKAETTGAFSKRGGFVPKVGNDEKLAAAVWALTKASPMPAGPIRTESAWVIVRLVERIEPSDEEFQKAKDQTIDQMAMEKGREITEAWVKHLRDQAKIEIHPLALSYDEEARKNERGGRSF